jgi:membrane-bound inhibitor of C-type lysozyme
MNNRRKPIIAIFVILMALLVIRMHRAEQKTESVQVSYACNEGKTIEATMYGGVLVPPKNEGEAPTLTGKATVLLSDGRNMELHQTISADGVRYANDDESFVFWTKGNGALVLENNQEKSYIGCIALRPDTGNLPKVYQDGQAGIALRYPNGYAIDTAYVYNELGPQKTAHGVKFIIPESMATGTNLASDSYISFEQIPQTDIPKGQSCTARLFVDPETPVVTMTEGDTEYSVASSTGAGAGNRYEEHVYAIPGTNPCIAVRYFIHYGVFENYPEGSVKRFDEKALLKEFDEIRQSLTINQ